MVREHETQRNVRVLAGMLGQLVAGRTSLLDKSRDLAPDLIEVGQEMWQQLVQHSDYRAEEKTSTIIIPATFRGIVVKLRDDITPHSCAFVYINRGD